MEAEFDGFANEFSGVGEDGWVQLAPFGDFEGRANIRISPALQASPVWPKIESAPTIRTPSGDYKRVAAIQRVDREAAEEMVREFKSFTGRVKRFVSGRKIYLGHPDVATVANEYPDKSPKGIITDLEVRPDGLYGRPAFNEEGLALVESRAVRAFSAHWSSQFANEEVGGKLVYRPNVLRSAGLTNRPQLPVNFFNEAEASASALAQAQQPNHDMNKLLLIALLNKHGATLANEATDEQITGAIDKIAGNVVTLANEKAALETQLVSERTAHQATVTERDALKTSFANERQARIATAITVAVSSGAIKPAEKPLWENRLSNPATFGNELAALEAIQPGGAMHTQSRTGNLGAHKADLANEQDRATKVNELVTAKLKSGLSYDNAFAAVRRENPELFAAMKQPGKE